MLVTPSLASIVLTTESNFRTDKYANTIMKSVSPSTPPLTPVDDDESERRTVMVSSHLFDVHMVSCLSLILSFPLSTLVAYS